MPAKGVLLCGVAVSATSGESGATAVVIGRITGLTGLGADRKAVQNIHNDLTNGWVEKLISCIKELKPFSISLVHDTNGSDWKTLITQSIGAFAITWPTEQGFVSGGELSFNAAVTDYTFGAPDIESRINATMTVTPSGEPTITSGND